MFSNYLSGIKDVSIFPIIGLLLFFGIFIVILIKVFSTDKKKMDQFSRIPLDSESEKLNNKVEI